MVLALIVVGACSRSGADASPADPSPSPDPATASATASPTEAAQPSVAPSLAVTPAESLAVEPRMPEPPAASIAVEGGDPVVGQLGTFNWENGGSGAPWLDGSPIHVGSGEQLTLSLAEPVGIGAWKVSRILPGNRDGVGALGMAQGAAGPVRFVAPPAGTWSVEVSVRFSDERGSALYYWRIEVD
jgi:hypothetical protein